MTLEQAAIPTFANHQTFHPRFGWIKKGYDAASADPNVFNEKSAPVELGVGKNMVEAIRFWALAAKVITRRPHPTRQRASVYVPTRLGRALLDDKEGLDPYIEDPTTLWILHWHALSAKTLLPVWWLTFNEFNAIEFSEQELVQFCVEAIAATTWSQPNPTSVQKDVDCLLRMYSRRDTQGRQTLDDVLDSPFRELGLICPSQRGEKHHYRIIRGAKPTLSAAAVTYACLDYLSRGPVGTQTITLSRLALDSGSPGRVFKLTEQDIAQAVEESAAVVGHLRLVRPAGARQLAISAPAGDVAFEVLAAHLAERGAGLPALSDMTLLGREASEPDMTDSQIERQLRKAQRSRAALAGGAA
jgi:hypothetical protein